MRLKALLAAAALLASAAAAQADGTVVVLNIKGGIGVATAEYILSGIEHAESSGVPEPRRPSIDD